MKSKKVLIPVIASLVTVLVLSGVSYAFYSAKIKENNKTETVIKSNVLGLEYTGVTDINVEDIVPGDSFTKTFTVKNTSNREVNYNIYMENITNEFNEDLVYTLTDENGEVVEETKLPETSDKSYLKTNVTIDANKTKTYTLKIEFKYTNEDQSALQGKTFKATVGIDALQTEIKKSEKNQAKISAATSNQPAIGSIKIVNNTSKTQTYDLMLSDLIDTSEITNGYNYSVEKNESVVISNEKLPATDQVILENQTIKPNTVDNYNATVNKLNGVSFADDSWETIQKAVKSGNYVYDVGDTKTITLASHTNDCASTNGSCTSDECSSQTEPEKQIQLRVANVTPCTTETSETACGFVVEFAEISEKHNYSKADSTIGCGTNSGGWPSSKLRTYVNNTIYKALPPELQRIIIYTTVKSGNGNYSYLTKVVTSSDKLYLLSSKEVYGEVSSSYDEDLSQTETRQLDYYNRNGVTQTNFAAAKKTYNNSEWLWWLRSANNNSSQNYFAAAPNGYWTSDVASNANGVAPAFRIG